MSETKRRARTVDEFREVQRRLRDAIVAAREGAPPFEVRSTDVIISPYGKCGTTLLQQGFHTLRTRGHMDFDDISRVVPWIEMSPVLGIDLNAPQVAGPRGFKSHLSYDSLPQGARYVVSLRDPKDAFASMYRFMEGWFIEPGAVTMEDYFEAWAKGGAAGEGYWHHLLSWWAVRDQPNVLLTSYNRMVRDPAGHVRRLADFIGVELDDELLALAVERTSRDWMLAHTDRFDDAMMRELSETVGGMPSGSDSAKVRRAGGKRGEEVPAALAARMDEIWAERITPVTGYASFDELEVALGH